MMKLIDMRTRFFFVSTLILLALIPMAPPDLNWVPKITAAVYVFLTFICLLDSISRNKNPKKQ